MQQLLPKMAHKTVEATGELMGNKNADKIVRQRPMSDGKTRKC